MDTARDSLRTGLVPAEVRKVLYDALRLLPDSMTYPTADVDQRPGVALALVDDLRRTEIIVNQRDGQFMGEREILTCEDPELGLEGGTVMMATAVRLATARALGAPPA